MFRRMMMGFVATVAFTGGLPSAAQPELSEQARREREQVQREQQARAQQARQVEHEAREGQARQQEQQARQLEQQVRQQEQQVRQLEQQTIDSAELRRELAQAREQLAASASEIARLSAELTRPVMHGVGNLYQVVVGGQARLGLNIQDTDLGVSVRGVTPNGPAHDAGVRVGDTIVAVDGVDLARGNGGDRRSPSQRLLAQLNDVEVGDEVRLRILRDGDYRDVVVEAREQRSPFVTYVGNEAVNIVEPGTWVTSLGRFGAGPWSDVELVTLTPDLGEYFGVDEGLLVLRAGRAAELGLRDGDVILAIGGRQPQSPEHAMRILGSFEPGESLETSIMRQRRRETLTMAVPERDASFDGWLRFGR